MATTCRSGFPWPAQSACLTPFLQYTYILNIWRCILTFRITKICCSFWKCCQILLDPDISLTSLATLGVKISVSCLDVIAQFFRWVLCRRIMLFLNDQAPYMVSSFETPSLGFLGFLTLCHGSVNVGGIVLHFVAGCFRKWGFPTWGLSPALLG